MDSGQDLEEPTLYVALFAQHMDFCEGLEELTIVLKIHPANLSVIVFSRPLGDRVITVNLLVIVSSTANLSKIMSSIQGHSVIVSLWQTS